MYVKRYMYLGSSLLLAFLLALLIIFSTSGWQSASARNDILENLPPNNAVTMAINSLSWITQTVATGHIGNHVSMVLDQSDHPHMVYCQFNESNQNCEGFWYAHFNGSNWITQSITSTYGMGAYASLALDSSNNPYVSFHDASQGWLRYAYIDESVWHTEVVQGEFNDWTGFHTSLFMDGTGKPHISYYDSVNQTISYATQLTTEWKIEPIEVIIDGALDTSISINNLGVPVVAYVVQDSFQPPENGFIKIATKGDPNWNIESLQTVLTTTVHDISLTHEDEYERLVFSGESTPGIYYAEYDAELWDIQTIDSSPGNTFRNPSIVLDSGNHPHIGYLKIVDNSEVYYAYLAGSTWQTTPIDRGSSLSGDGWTVPIDVDSNNEPHLSFYKESDDINPGELMYVHGQDLCPVDLISVTISGPTRGVISTSIGLTASPIPTNTTGPITYMWDPEPISGQGNAAASFSWVYEGYQEVWVQATACDGMAQNSHSIIVLPTDPYTWEIDSSADTLDFGTLRFALEHGQAGDTIVFSPDEFTSSPKNPITLTSPLPEIDFGNLTIDGTGAIVIIDGSNLGVNEPILHLSSNDNEIVRLELRNAPGAGIFIEGDDNLIGWNGDGVCSGGKNAGPPEGPANEIHHNGTGIIIEGDGNDIKGNWIRDNTNEGVSIIEGVSNVIGGEIPGDGNVIGGNTKSGISLSGALVSSNGVFGNYIGTNWDGNSAYANGFHGVGIYSSSASNQIGGSLPCRGNIISGNSKNGVRLDSAGTNNLIQGNFIGISEASVAIKNGEEGIVIYDTASATIGGHWSVSGCTGACNVISGNDEDGINIRGTSSTLNKVWGNFIGTNISGTQAVPNEYSGIRISSTANNNEIGGSSTQGNLISGNTDYGIYLALMGVDNNLIQNNIIGVDFAQEHALPNQTGIWLQSGPQDNVIRDNTIAGNVNYGIYLYGVDTTGNMIEDNQIGMVLTSGPSAFPQVVTNQSGIYIDNGAKFNTIGGDSPHQGNTITQNAVAGIQVQNSPNNTIKNNTITDNLSLGVYIHGIDAAWNNIFFNQVDNNGSAGIQLDTNSSKTDVLSNTIHTNGWAGIAIVGSTYNEIKWNEIYDNNHTGIVIYDDAQNNDVIGNQIHGNDSDQIIVSGPDTIKNKISQNEITDNGSLKLNNILGGNTELAPPVITEYGLLPGGWTIRGESCASCWIEIFSTAGITHSLYVSTTRADDTGHFEVTGVDMGIGHYFDATARTGIGNTSEYASQNNGVLDLKIDAIEVVQSVQTLDNEITLIAGKQTYVRVHVSSNWDIPIATTARLWINQSGDSLGPIDPGPQPGCPLEIGVAKYPDRGMLYNAFCFLIPDEWTEAGAPLNIFAEVNPDKNPKEMTTSNNAKYEAVTFVDSEPIPVKYFMVIYKENLFKRATIEDLFTYKDSFTLGNIDSDGKDEIILGDAETHELMIYEHTSGKYGMGKKTTIASTVDTGYSFGDQLTAGDLDGDGLDEIIIGHPSDHTVDIWTWNSTIPTPTWTLAISDYNLGIATTGWMKAGDPDQDGMDEIVFSNHAANSIKICDLDGGFNSTSQGINAGTFSCDTHYVPHSNMEHLAVGDLNPGGSNRDEILISDRLDDKVYIYAIVGENLVLQTSFGSSFDTLNIVRGSSLAIGDLDNFKISNQSYAEILVSDNTGLGAWIYRWTGTEWEFVVLANGWGDSYTNKLMTTKGRLAIGHIYGTSSQAEMVAGTTSGESGIKIFEKNATGIWRIMVPDVRFIYETSSMLSRMYPVSGVSKLVSLLVLDPADGAPNNYLLYQKLSRERALANAGGGSDKHYTYTAMFNGDGAIGGGQASGDRKTVFPMSIDENDHVTGIGAARHEIGHTRNLGHVYVPICGPHSNDVIYPAPQGLIVHPGPALDFRILNTSSLGSPTLVSGIEMDGYPRDIVVQGNYAYIAYYHHTKAAGEYLGGLAIYDISDEENPVFKSLLPLNGGPRRLVVNGNYAYIADVYGGLYAANISDPMNPYITDQYQLPELNDRDNEAVRKNAHMFDLHLEGDKLYAASYPYLGWSENYDGGVIIFDVSIPSQLRIPIEITGTDSPYSVYVDGGYVYVGSSYGLEIYAPGIYDETLSKLYFERSWDVVVSNDIAYVGTEDGLKIADVSDPANPSYIEHVILGERVYEIEIDGNYAYVATRMSGLKIINISDPHNAVVVGVYDTPGSIFVTHGLTVDGGSNRVYLATFDSGVYGMDTGDLIRNFPPEMMSPYEYFDFMSYSDTRGGCGEQWMSVHSYYELIDEINDSWISKEFSIMSVGDVLHVTGFGDSEELNGELTSLMRLPSDVSLSDNPLTSTVHLQLQGATGTILADYPLEADTFSDVSADDEITSFMVDSVVNFVSGTTTITLVISDSIVATQTVSVNPPTVTLTISDTGQTLSGDFTLSWEAGDPDNDPLTFFVLHSADGGVSWTIIAEIQNKTSITLTTDFLAGSTDTYFRVFASDGVNTAFIDNINPITIAQRIPEVWIGAPVDRSFLTSEQTVYLFADAWDPDLKEIDSGNYLWSSNLDGPLGTGKELLIGSLSPGIHQITVSVTDADGDTAQDTVTVFVDAYLVYLPLVIK